MCGRNDTFSDSCATFSDTSLCVLGVSFEDGVRGEGTINAALSTSIDYISSQ